MNAVNQQLATSNQQPAPRYQCRHIFTDGRRCASPSLRGEHFCYFHHTTRRPIAPETQKERRRTTARLSEFHMPLPEDRSAIQSAIGMVLQRIAANDLDPRRAGLLLYGLQIASLNLPKQQPQRDEDTEEVVEEITTHPEHGTLAPQTEIQEKKSSIALFLEELRNPQPQPKPAVLPQIQATAQSTKRDLETADEAEVSDEGRQRNSPEYVYGKTMELPTNYFTTGSSTKLASPAEW